jgi:hypothetical protein
MAAFNNAEWCAAIWRSHGLPVEEAHGLWFCAGRVPQYYPNVVTIDATADVARQCAFIAELMREAGAVGFSVKDSFSRLDLDSIGMSIMFVAQWLLRPRVAMARNETITLAWDTVEDQQGLADWELAWRGTDVPQTRIFLPALLNNPKMVVLGGRNGHGALLAGGIAFEAAGSLGITNVFGDRREFFAALARLKPNASLVCYEPGVDLTPALQAGFQPLGPLRVWKSDESGLDTFLTQ